jgi:hypothetical protein
MKTQKAMTLVGLAIAVALLAAPVMAQTVNLKADIPFAFNVSKVALSPGTCTVKMIAEKTVVLRDADNNHAITMLTLDDVRGADNPKMIFRRYGDHYFLARIETPDAAYQLPVSARETRLAHAGSPQLVAVLASAFTEAR